jgi:predicted DNA-binding transcriptional regulator AlpA
LEDSWKTEPLLNSKDVQRLLNCSKALVYRLASDGRLPAIKIPCPGKGKKRKRYLIRFLKKDVLDFVEEFYPGNR